MFHIGEHNNENNEENEGKRFLQSDVLDSVYKR